MSSLNTHMQSLNTHMSSLRLHLSGSYIGLLVLTSVGKFAVSGSFNIVYLLAAEMFPTVLRTMGLGMSSMWARVGATIAPFVAILVGIRECGHNVQRGVDHFFLNTKYNLTTIFSPFNLTVTTISLHFHFCPEISIKLN